MCVVGVTVFLFFINFMVTFCIYPHIVESKMNTYKRILNVKIKISKFRYISSCINCGCMILILLYEYYKNIRYSIDTDTFFVVMTVLAIVSAVNLFRIIFIYPKRYIVFKNNKMYYHDGFREKYIDNIRSTIQIKVGKWDWYWYLLLKTDTGKRIWIDVLLFDKPECVYSAIKSMKFIA